MKCVILAGGSGERFWPISTRETPKQFLRLFSEKTLLRETFERISAKLDPKDIYIVTNRAYAELTRVDVPEVPRENILLEPLKKNTAPACTYATLNFDPSETIFIVPADHYVPNVEDFWRYVQLGQKTLQEHEAIITFGIVPSRAETAYGYIEAGERIDEYVFEVNKFHEKPDHQTALSYLEKGNYFWNSGMFMYKVGYFIEQMKKHAPQVIEPFLKKRDLEQIYREVPSISIDYALMEKADRIVMVKAEFVWSDVGNFNSLKDLGVKNSQHTVVMNTENLFVKTSKPIIVIGVSDTIIVENENGILVCKMDQLDRLREALKVLEQKMKDHER
jgi:mannose-1-phosphate guanylyltransferase